MFWGLQPVLGWKVEGGEPWGPGEVVGRGSRISQKVRGLVTLGTEHPVSFLFPGGFSMRAGVCEGRERQIHTDNRTRFLGWESGR